MRKIIKLEGLCCANCASKIETEVQKLNGVSSAALSFMTQRLTLDVDDSLADAIIEETRKISYKIEPEAEFKIIR